jgi:hypothetical protein
MRDRTKSLVLTLTILGACSSGGYNPGAGDGHTLPHDLAAAGADLGLVDLQGTGGAGDAAGGCVTSLICDARTADHGCGVPTATGQRYPDQGLPYCTGDKTMRQGCSCDLVRCSSVMPLCPGTYQAIFTERLVQGCHGVVNDKGGTCFALWNTVKTSSDGTALFDRTVYNVDLDWAFTSLQNAFRITAPTLVQAVVQQDCWLSDVSGSGNAGRSEVSKITIMQQ